MESLNISWVTLPSKRPPNPLRPWEPMMMMRVDS